MGALALALAACGTEGEPASRPTATSTTAPAGTPRAAETVSPTAPAAFPVRIEHKFGITEVPREPERAVTIGFNEQDAVLALGVTPVAVREWFGGYPHPVWPWGQDELGNGQPIVLNMPFGELDFEAIAALRPDVIIALYSGITEDEYVTLSRIAPTVAQSGDYVDFGMPWQEMTLAIGRALGREERAAELVADVEARFAAAREEHPEFVGATGIMAAPGADGQYFLYGAEDGRSRVLASLGFEMPAAIADLVGDAFYASVSAEQLSLLDADVVVWQVESPEQRAAVEGDPLYDQLDVAREGRALFLVGHEPLRGAFGFSTVLSLPFLLDGLLPMLSAAVDGDPATEAAARSDS
jgi:iron complex transport system substrate-binding protein